MLIAKYKPRTFNEILGNPNCVAYAQSCVRLRDIPNSLFYGPPGIGKTLTADIMVETLYGEDAKGYCYRSYNAADLSKKDVTEQLEKFGQHSLEAFAEREEGLKMNFPFPPFKTVIVDECEKISSPVETLLRTKIQDSYDWLRFILICNDINHPAITGPILSRLTILQFLPLTSQEMRQGLSNIVQKEGINITPQQFNQIIWKHSGDLRGAIMELQLYV